MALTIVVPVKALAEGKSRLSTVLDQRRRRAMCGWMLRRTLAKAAAFADTLVVSSDPSVDDVVRRAGHQSVSFLRVASPDSLNAAVAQARERLSPGSSMLVLPIDLVCLGSATLLEVCAKADTVTIAPDEAGTGTNLLYLPAAVVPTFAFGFGEASFQFHVAQARRLGFEPRVHRSQDAAFDLDCARDWQRLVADRSRSSLTPASV